MDILGILVTLAIVGFLLWIIVTYVPMPQPFQRVLIALIVLLVVIWVLRMLAPGFLVFPRASL